MTRLTAAPTTPTNRDICAPNRTREKTSRPWKSVPNQCCASGGANWASASRLGSWACTKAAPDSFNITGQARTASSKKARYQALMTAARFRRKRCQARWPGVTCSSEFGVRSSELMSLIFHPRIEQRVGEVHHQIHRNEQQGVKQRKTDHKGIIAVQRT